MSEARGEFISQHPAETSRGKMVRELTKRGKHVGEDFDTSKKGAGTVTPVDMEGTLYASKVDQSTLDLVHEISAPGRLFTVSETEFEYKTPFVRTRGVEIVGVEAIRRYYKVGAPGLVES